MESMKQNIEVKVWKFVKWDVEPLSKLRTSKVYMLREKLNKGQKMSREEKDWLAEKVNTNTYFRTAVPLRGYCFDFLDVLKKYVVNQYGHWSEYYAKTTPNLAKANIKNADKSLKGLLRRFFALAPTKMGATSSLTIPTNFSDDTLDNRIIKRVASNNATYFNAELFAIISKDLLNAIHTAFKKPGGLYHQKLEDGYVYDDLDPAFVTALEQNIFHFSAAKTLAEIQQLNQEFRKAKSFEEFTKKATSICGKFNKVWQKTEYDTSLLTAESVANYQRLIKKANLFPYWKYVTAGDEKVREEHRKLNDVTLYWEDSRWDKIYPPNGWKCRCRVVPLMKHEGNNDLLKRSQDITDDYMQSDEWKKIKATHFDSNVGKRQHIFDNNQMYVRKFPTKAAKLMEKVTPDDWGLKHSYKQLIRDAKQKVTRYEGKASDWWNLHKKVVENEEVLPIEDFNNRIWYMGRKSFDEHTTDTKKKRAFRTKYLDVINEVMKYPDEVWIGQDEKDKQGSDQLLNRWFYIKYYDGIAIVCVCKIQDGKLNFKSWYELHDNKVRKGLLIF